MFLIVCLFNKINQFHCFGFLAPNFGVKVFKKIVFHRLYMVINVFILSLSRCYECFYTYLFLLNEFSIPSLQALICPNIVHSCLGRICGLFNFHIIYEEILTINMVKCDIFRPKIINVHLVWHAQRVMISSKSTLCTHFTPPLKLVHIVTIILLSSTC